MVRCERRIPRVRVRVRVRVMVRVRVRVRVTMRKVVRWYDAKGGSLN